MQYRKKLYIENPAKQAALLGGGTGGQHVNSVIDALNEKKQKLRNVMNPSKYATAEQTLERPQNQSIAVP